MKARRRQQQKSRTMVDVKLDLEDNPLSKLTAKRLKSFSACNFLVYFTFFVGLAVIGLDAAEFISMGIVKDVMGLKVMKYEEYNDLVKSTKDLKKQVKDVTRSMEKELKTKQQMLDFGTENFQRTKALKDALQQQLNEKEDELEVAKNEIANLKSERDQLKAAAVPKEDAAN